MRKVKISRIIATHPQVVGTVHSPGSLRAALRLAPGAVDFLELRVDHFADEPEKLLRAALDLPAPLIVTVRHPAEGGMNDLAAERRRELFAQFLPVADWIDLELRSVGPFAETIAAAIACDVKVIVSDHYFDRTPPLRTLQARHRRAGLARADVFKTAALTTTPAHVATLLGLFQKKPIPPLSVMGMGSLGKASRLLFAQAGSVFNYGYLDQANASGQWEATLLKKRLAELSE